MSTKKTITLSIGPATWALLQKHLQRQQKLMPGYPLTPTGAVGALLTLGLLRAAQPSDLGKGVNLPENVNE